ncbi:helix-turn-helix domain-containing protein [Kocuria marina]|uniref:helix-turn-helix domain-containing protein n=1 Tax=Kocuria marina TaxID=223184 RepID=UPI0022E4E423|nr:helix-turn-helix transcriptional regulator [Kocuria marina]
MAGKKLDLGGTGERVRENVKRLRGSMQYKELAEKLELLGNPIPPLGLRRIEAGERRVSVDDLCALAVALDVAPVTLLLPSDGSRELSSALTGVRAHEVAHNVQWLWGLGDEPLTLPGAGLTEEARREVATFRARCRPHVQSRSTAVASFAQPEESTESRDSRLVERSTRLAETQGLMPGKRDDGNGVV